MSLVKERERRSNAGSRMRALLNQEVEIEELFEYKENDESDQEFLEKMIEEEEDKVDSDFDLDSSEGEQEHVEEGRIQDKEIAKEEKKSHKSVIPKTFKAPRKPLEKRKRKRETESAVSSNEDRIVRQSSRRNTMLNRILLEGQLKESEKKKAAQPKREKSISYELSQEELLAEAAITEEKNMSSLLEWQKKEEERKANVKVKRGKELKEPYIRYYSYIERCPEEGKEEDESKEDLEPMGRNFVTFLESFEEESIVTDDLESTELINCLSSWSDKRPKPNKPCLCPITGELAIYKDPYTNVPYANINAYRVIKSCLKNQMKWSSTLGLYLGNLPSAKGVPEGWD